jgi:hypothetical protein
MGEEHPLQVARCTKIIKVDPKAAEAARAVPLGAVRGRGGAGERDGYFVNIGLRSLWSVLGIGLLRRILRKGCVLDEWMRKCNISAIDTV